VWIKWGSQFEGTLPLIKAKYIFNNSLDPQDFLQLLQKQRYLLDNTTLEFSEVTRLSPELSVIYRVIRPPLFFMRAKDFIEKCIRFEHGGKYYGYSSSVPSNGFPFKEQYQHCETIFSGSILTKEEDSYVYYEYSQTDLKVLSNGSLDWKYP